MAPVSRIFSSGPGAALRTKLRMIIRSTTRISSMAREAPMQRRKPRLQTFHQRTAQLTRPGGVVDAENQTADDVEGDLLHWGDPLRPIGVHSDRVARPIRHRTTLEPRVDRVVSFGLKGPTYPVSKD